MPTTYSQLIEKFLTNSLTSGEELLFSEWSKKKENLELLRSAVDTALKERRYEGEEDLALREQIYSQLAHKLEERKAGRLVSIGKQWWIRVAAAALLILVAGYWWLNRRSGPDHRGSMVVETTNDIPPGHEGAILTLANGQKISLDSLGDGNLAILEDVTVEKKGGQLIYESPKSTGNRSEQTAISLNTLTTPIGRQYALTLSDGSKVWLNAESSITYPAVFSEKERRVMITGEAYFEVAKLSAAGDSQHIPFIVSNGNTEVEVLGTHFNVNSYEDEEVIRVTLLEGKVKVSRQPAVRGQQSAVILEPGQQAIIGNQQLTINKTPDIETVIAWKNGYFSFVDASTEEIMRQVKRWYDAEIVYEGDVKNERFAGSVPRSANASKLLEVLELTKTVKFTIEGNKIIVKPYR